MIRKMYRRAFPRCTVRKTWNAKNVFVAVRIYLKLLATENNVPIRSAGKMSSILPPSRGRQHGKQLDSLQHSSTEQKWEFRLPLPALERWMFASTHDFHPFTLRLLEGKALIKTSDGDDDGRVVVIQT